MFYRQTFTLDQEDTILEAYKLGESTVSLAKKYQVANSTLFNLLKRRGVEMRGRSGHKRYFVDEEFFNVIDSHIKAYIFGFWMADGSVHKLKRVTTLTVHTRDKYILELVASEMKYTGPIYASNNASILSISSTKMCQSLIALGCVPAKSLVLEFPDILDEFLPSFCLGYFDGDGCISKRGQVSICGTESFCESITKALHKREIYSKVVPTNSKVFLNVIQRQKEAYHALKWMYSNAPFYLKRKHDRFLELEQHLNSKE